MGSTIKNSKKWNLTNFVGQTKRKKCGKISETESIVLTVDGTHFNVNLMKRKINWKK